MAWNPFDRPDRVWRDLESSRQDTGIADADGNPVLGEPEAAVAFQAWTAGDRLAFMDLIATATLTKREGDDGDTVRIGTLQAIHVALTAREVRGFPNVPITRVREDGTAREVVEVFNVRDRAHLALLPSDVFAELFEHAQDVQPMPTATDRRKAAAGSTEDATTDGGDAPVLMLGADDEDPSPTPSTPGT